LPNKKLVTRPHRFMLSGKNVSPARRGQLARPLQAVGNNNN